MPTGGFDWSGVGNFFSSVGHFLFDKNPGGVELNASGASGGSSLSPTFDVKPVWNVIGELTHTFEGNPIWKVLGELAHLFEGEPAWKVLGELAHTFEGSPLWRAVGELVHTFEGNPIWQAVGDLFHLFEGEPIWDVVGELAHLFEGTPLWRAVGELVHEFEGFAHWIGQNLEHTFTAVANWIGQNLSQSFTAVASWIGPAFAGGVEGFGGGVAMVGENGPEIVALPSGSSVYPIASSGVAGNVSPINFGGSTPQQTQTLAVNIDGRALAVAMAPYIVSDLRLVLGAR